MSERIYRIAVDGPSGAGKSTIAREVARRLDIEYIDTGAMYRAIGYKVAEHVADRAETTVDDFIDSEAFADLIDKTSIDLIDGRIMLDGVDVSDRIRTPEMSMMASKCSAIPAVREKLVEIQREMGRRKSVIMDGRDIGTNVLKDAEYKIYLTASAEERAQRRHRELAEKGEAQSYEEVLEDIIRRDHNDMTRKLNPLKKADDAIEIDSTGMSIDQVIEEVLKLVE